MIVVHSTPFDFKRAHVAGLKPLVFEKGLFSGKGFVESAPIQTSEPFDNLVGSFNAEVPKGASVQMDAQVSVDGVWSIWYGLVRWDGGNGGASLGTQEDALGHVDTDTLMLKKKATAFRYRIQIQGSGTRAPKLSRVAVTCVNSQERPAPTKPFQPGPWVREIKLKPLSQILEQKRFSQRINKEEPVLCSPVSLAMVLEHWGQRKDTLEVAELVRDRQNLLFGNWPLNIQAAANYGLSGHVARLANFEELQDEIAQGRPVIASVTIKKGDLRAEPKRATAGHLVVVSGFTRAGDVIVYDPFAPNRSGVRRIYPRQEFRRIWLERKLGLVYVLGPRFPQKMTVGVAVTDLCRKPREPSRFDPLDRNRVSQLPQGQPVHATKVKGDWVQVEAIEQPHWNGKIWQGYNGWVRVEDLTSMTETAVEATSTASPEIIIETAERFLGVPYIWGALSPMGKLRGLDCSGLVYLSYRAAGLTVPRDAKDQHRKAAKIRRSALQPGDLLFLAKPAPEIYHVLLYAGGDSIIESREKAGVLKTTFQERFGKFLSELEAGNLVDNLSGQKPARVRISFGSFLHD